MALTNFAALTPEQKTVWSRDVWREAREMMFINKFVGSDENSIIQRITELTKTEKGERVLMHLLADLQSDGVVGDNEREGHEEEMKTYTDDITIDLITHGVRQKGKLAEQKTVVSFRNHAKDVLSYWLANRIDQLAFLTLSSVPYTFNNDGSRRKSGAFASLAFNDASAAPSANRHYRITAAGTLAAGDTTSDDHGTLSYNALVDIGVKAKVNYVKPLVVGGKEYYIVFLRPEAMAQLKKDSDYQNAVVTGLPRSEKNPFFTGATVTVDGLVLHEHRLVFNTVNASAADQWGDGGNDWYGSRILVCGAQALGMADLGSPEWSEKLFNYDSSPGINVDKMFGFHKPRFYSTYNGGVEDFGVIALDHKIADK